MEALLGGNTTTDAAAEAGVHRSTLHRWQNEPEFKAAANTRRSEFRHAAEARLERLQTMALDAVEKALATGNSHVALAILRGLGFLPGSSRTIGSTDPERLQRQRESHEKERQLLDDLGMFDDV